MGPSFYSGPTVGAKCSHRLTRLSVDSPGLGICLFPFRHFYVFYDNSFTPTNSNRLLLSVLNFSSSELFLRGFM
ncbi:hypothetical protein VNO80_10781 [Phaseolus coccineus]|uniref:Uncharacterized protein n=1 Tax=Phaseolus coccineus TaxID=3886 RepID=A0AAN9RDQ8_PHACN